MKIYTKTGDRGTTQVYSKEVLRLSKDDILLDNYGNLDELNSQIGLLHAFINEHNITLPYPIDLGWIQNTLFAIGFAMSDDDNLSEDISKTLETWIDLMTAELPAQTSFILPGGSIPASQAHVCRTITRRAERTLVALGNDREINPIAMQFTNRLSDFFFTTARFLNYLSKVNDIKVTQ